MTDDTARSDDPTSLDIALSDLLRHYAPARARKHAAWTWEDEDISIRTRMCLCCGRPGHYQAQLERHIARHGMDGMAVYLDGRYVGDGHHRVIAARALGIERVPLESKDDAGARWVRDHGYVSWDERTFGDV